MKQSVKMILASGSPRRKELFERVGIKFSVIKSDAEEVITKTNPEEVVLELAQQKASEVRDRILNSNFAKEKIAEEIKAMEEDLLIVGADTIVVSEGIILGKPVDEEDALRILMSLSGKEHSVFTGVSAIYIKKEGEVDQDRSLLFVEETKVAMHPFMEEDARAYIDTKEPMDKAGAYGIQGIGGILVKEIHGDYNNVVGFPLSAFVRLGCQKKFFRL